MKTNPLTRTDRLKASEQSIYLANLAGLAKAGDKAAQKELQENF